MKVIITSLDDSNLICVGGKHIHQQLLGKGLQELGFEVVNIFPRKGVYYFGVRVMFLIFEKLGLRKRSTTFAWTLNYLKRNLEKHIRPYLSDTKAIFAQDPVAGVAATDAVRNSEHQSIPVVMTLHGYLGRESVNYGSYRNEEAAKVVMIARLYEKSSLEQARRVITVDSKISDYLRSEFNYQKPHVILKNAINPDLFTKFSTDELSAFRSQFAVNAEKKIVLVPRRLVRKNGVDIALLAAAELKKLSSTNFYFLVIGDGPERKALEDLKKQLNLTDKEFLFRGSIDHKDAALYYAASDIVLVPSVIRDGVEEAVSLSMLEGMAAKKIVIVSNIGGMKEVIRHKQNGFVFEQANHHELVQVLNEVLQMNEAELAEINANASKIILEEHHYRTHTKSYLQQISPD